MFALIDCNNFYASCERLFRPDLYNKPLVVLSNNDGCVIARSNEAKMVGIKMGEPYFKIKSLCTQYKVAVFSSNYALYHDMSQRVMSIIEEAWPQVEIYSIDEAFIDLYSMPSTQHLLFCQDLQKYILKATGIPTSIGIGPTKTLAKIANHLCKKELKIPVFNINNQQHWLKRVAVGEVWGVGRKWQRKLVERGIHNAYDLANADPQHIKKNYNVVLMRTALELQGIICAQLQPPEPRQSILSSRSFGEMQTELAPLTQAISSHCTRVAEKLRKQKQLAYHLAVFVRSNRFRQDLAQYTNSMEVHLIQPTDDSSVLIHHAKQALGKIYKPGFHYKKVGVYLGELIPKGSQQLDLFNQPSEEYLTKREQLMEVFDAINQKYGRHTIKIAAEGYNKSWSMRMELKSPAYTTSWKELVQIT